MKKKIEILGHEDRTSKKGKDYTSFSTTEGTASCFESDVIDKLKEIEKKGTAALVEIVESKGFLNIRQFYEEVRTKKPENPNQKQVKDNYVDKTPRGKGKDKQINKAVALKASVSLVSGVLNTEEVENAAFWEMASHAAIAIGNRFENWLNETDVKEGESDE
ncbi:MAG: hypothetical protein ACOC5T_01920 [Elusimicrobiota bacterium]